MPWDQGVVDPAGVAPRSSGASRRAAIGLWVSGAAESVIFGCCSALVTVAGVVPPEALELPDEQAAEFAMVQHAILLLGVGVFVLMFLPAVALLLLGFAVRRGGGRAIQWGRAIVAVHIGLVSLLLLFYLIAGLGFGQLLAMVFTVPLLAGLVALLIWTMTQLSAASHERWEREARDTEPWNSRLS